MQLVMQPLEKLRDWNRRNDCKIVFINFGNGTILLIRKEASLLVVKFSLLGTNREKNKTFYRPLCRKKTALTGDIFFNAVFINPEKKK